MGLLRSIRINIIRLLCIPGIVKLCIIFSGSLAASSPSQESPGINPETPQAASNTPLFPEPLIALPSADKENVGLARTAVLVDKSDRTLKVFQFKGETPFLVYETQTDLGKRDGDKERTNDHKTPVGLYFLTGKKSPPEIPFDLYGKMAFETNYPNLFDRLAKKTGSGIWLHAVPDSVPLTRGSRGCVVVRNQSIERIAELVEPGQTPMLILSEIQNLTEEQFKAHRSSVFSALDRWKKSWESQDLPTYLSHYDPKFKAAGMNLSKWKRHKEKLKKVNGEVKVEIIDPMIVRNKDQILIRFLQKYMSAQTQDYGEKTIVGTLSASGELKILSEEWTPRENPAEKLTTAANPNEPKN